jgi:hypothetical protein
MGRNQEGFTDNERYHETSGEHWAGCRLQVCEIPHGTDPAHWIRCTSPGTSWHCLTLPMSPLPKVSDLLFVNFINATAGAQELMYGPGGAAGQTSAVSQNRDT